MAANRYDITRAATVRDATSVAAHFDITFDNQRLDTWDEHNGRRVGGFVIQGGEANGTPFISFDARTGDAPASSGTGPYSLTVSNAVRQTGEARATLTLDRDGTPFLRAQLRMMRDTESPVGYGWELRVRRVLS
jgi:hypothetical protein